MDDMRRIAFETVARACGFGSLGIFCFMVGLSFKPVVAFQAGDEHRHHDRPFGHPVALTFLRRRPEDMAALLTRAGFAPHSRTVREADPTLDETAAQAFLIARRGA